jgi:pyrroloquinoline-quinone synthase
MEANTWWNEIEETIRANFMLDHPFNKAWREGRLKLEDIKFYSKQYFQHVDAFPRYVSAVHTNTPDLPTRQMLLDNLMEEERGSENHPELWLRFCEGAGVSREEVASAAVRPETKECIQTFMDLAKNPNHLAGLAALYAYESQIPELSATKVQRLDVHYGITDERAYKFFRVHEKADVWHSEVERKALMEGAKTEEDRALIKASVEAACKAAWKLFDGIALERQIPLS